MHIGQRIRQARQAYGMSQAELSRRIGISKQAMNSLERGETDDPRFSTVDNIAHALGLPLAMFSLFSVDSEQK